MEESRSGRWLSIVSTGSWIAGLLCLLRVIPVLMMLFLAPGANRLPVICLFVWDLSLGAVMVVAGFAMSVQMTWARYVCAIVWGAWVTDAVLFLVGFLGWMTHSGGLHEFRLESSILWPRLAFDGAAALWGPWSCWVIATAADEPVVSRRGLGLSMMMGMLIGGGMLALLGFLR